MDPRKQSSSWLTVQAGDTVYALPLVGVVEVVRAVALAAAAAGRYTAWSFREQADRYRSRYFIAEGTRYRLRDTIRRLVTFRYRNLVEEPGVWPTPDTAAMDVIFCRNVLLYLTPEASQAAVHRLYRALAPGGWLFLSPTDPRPEPGLGLLRHNVAGTAILQRPRQEPATAMGVRPERPVPVRTSAPATSGPVVPAPSQIPPQPLSTPPPLQDITETFAQARTFRTGGHRGAAAPAWPSLGPEYCRRLHGVALQWHRQANPVLPHVRTAPSSCPSLILS